MYSVGTPVASTFRLHQRHAFLKIPIETGGLSTPANTEKHHHPQSHS